MRVFKKYVKGQPHIVLSVLDKEATLPAQPDNYEIPTSGDNPFPTTNYDDLTYKKVTGDKFDRSKRPGLGENPVVQVPEFWDAKFDNGMKVIGTNSNEIPTVSLQLTINGGHKLDAHDKEKAGLASLTASLINKSTKTILQKPSKKHCEN